MIAYCPGKQYQTQTLLTELMVESPQLELNPLVKSQATRAPHQQLTLPTTATTGRGNL